MCRVFCMFRVIILVIKPFVWWYSCSCWWALYFHSGLLMNVSHFKLMHPFKLENNIKYCCWQLRLIQSRCRSDVHISTCRSMLWNEIFDTSYCITIKNIMAKTKKLTQIYKFNRYHITSFKKSFQKLLNPTWTTTEVVRFVTGQESLTKKKGFPILAILFKK